MTPTNGFIPMISSAGDNIIYHNGATDYFDAISKIDLRLNSTPISERFTKPVINKPTAPKGKPSRRSLEDILESHGDTIVELYENGCPYHEIAARFSMSNNTISKVLRAKGVTPGDVSKRLREQREKKVKK